MAEINQSGGVLGGRQMDIITRDHHAITARGIKNIREFVGMPDVVAVLGGRFSLRGSVLGALFMNASWFVGPLFHQPHLQLHLQVLHRLCHIKLLVQQQSKRQPLREYHLNQPNQNQQFLMCQVNQE